MTFPHQSIEVSPLCGEMFQRCGLGGVAMRQPRNPIKDQGNTFTVDFGRTDVRHAPLPSLAMRYHKTDRYGSAAAMTRASWIPKVPWVGRTPSISVLSSGRSSVIFDKTALPACMRWQCEQFVCKYDHADPRPKPRGRWGVPGAVGLGQRSAGRGIYCG